MLYRCRKKPACSLLLTPMRDLSSLPSHVCPLVARETTRAYALRLAWRASPELEDPRRPEYLAILAWANQWPLAVGGDALAGLSRRSVHQFGTALPPAMLGLRPSLRADRIGLIVSSEHSAGYVELLGPVTPRSGTGGPRPSDVGLQQSAHRVPGAAARLFARWQFEVPEMDLTLYREEGDSAELAQVGHRLAAWYNTKLRNRRAPGRPRRGRLDQHTLAGLVSGYKLAAARAVADELPPPTEADFAIGELGVGVRMFERRLERLGHSWGSFLRLCE
jgi:hypothetical protein